MDREHTSFPCRPGAKTETERNDDMKRRFFPRLLLAAALTLALSIPIRAARRTVTVQVDAQPLAAGAYVTDGVTYAPLRALLNALGDGWTIWWDHETAQAAAWSDTISLRADPSADTLTVNSRTLSGRVTVENGVTYVPLRLLCEALGCAVEWDPYLGGAAVTTPDAAYDASELYWLSRLIYAESGGEPLTGQIAVGNVVLNRVASEVFPDTVRDVIFDRKDAVQFEPVANGTLYQTPSAQSVEAAKRALDGENVIGDALYFYAPALSQGTWINANRVYSQTIGCHRFYI